MSANVGTPQGTLGNPQQQPPKTSFMPQQQQMASSQPIQQPPPTQTTQQQTQQTQQQGTTTPGNTTQQPGTTPPQNKPRIDPNQIPSPVLGKYPDLFKKHTYRTVASAIPPPANYNVLSMDEGNCNPKFIRPTISIAPQSKDMLNESALYFGAVLQPLAELDPEEGPIPVVNFGEIGPIRCKRCRAYINPFVTFTSNGTKYTCNICEMSNDVPREYVCNLDPQGKRRDVDQRPELRYGCVEFVGSTPEYCANRTLPLAPLSLVFVVDASQTAKTQGVTQSALESIRKSLLALSESEVGRSTSISIITYAKAIHFYSVRKDTMKPQIFVVANNEEAFVPFHDNGLFSLQEPDSINTILDSVSSYIQNIRDTDSSMGAALDAAKQMLSTTGGGRIIMFSSQLPNVGTGAFKSRKDFEYYGTEKERELYIPQQTKEGLHWVNAAVDCAKKQIAVDLYLFHTTYIEASTLGHLCGVTCGHLYVYSGFSPSRDSDRLDAELYRNVSREMGYDGVLRVRCSKGLAVKKYYGHFFEQNALDMDLPGIDADKAFVAELTYEDKLEGKDFAYLQSALLYTTRDGQRRVRVQTLRLSVANTIANVFRSADLDATVNVMGRLAIHDLITKKNGSVERLKESMLERCVEILTSYRKNCATHPSPGQLILPEALKLLPIFVLSFIKSPAVRPGTDVLLDQKYFNMFYFMSLSARLSHLYLYPRLFSLDSVAQHEQDAQTVAFPQPLNLSSERIDHGDIFVLDDTISTTVWVGRNTPVDTLRRLFGVTSFDQINFETVKFQEEFDDQLALRVRQLLGYLHNNRPVSGSLRFIKDRDPRESQMFARLVEDKSSSFVSYVEFLCDLHRRIQHKLA